MVMAQILQHGSLMVYHYCVCLIAFHLCCADLTSVTLLCLIHECLLVTYCSEQKMLLPNTLAIRDFAKTLSREGLESNGPSREIDRSPIIDRGSAAVA